MTQTPIGAEGGADGDASGGTTAGGSVADASVAAAGGSVATPAVPALPVCKRYAAQASASKVGTEHVLAGALEVFPAVAERHFGPALYEQLGDLLDKSQLGPPPPDAPSGERLSTEADAAPLLALWEGGAGPEALFGAISSLPDQAAATQLLEMAKIFADRA